MPAVCLLSLSPTATARNRYARSDSDRPDRRRLSVVSVTDRYASNRYARNRYARSDRDGTDRWRRVLSARVVQDSGTTSDRCRRPSVVTVTDRYARYRYAPNRYARNRYARSDSDRPDRWRLSVVSVTDRYARPNPDRADRCDCRRRAPL